MLECWSFCNRGYMLNRTGIVFFQFSILSLLFANGQTDNPREVKANSSAINENDGIFDGFLNIKVSHGRTGTYPFGPKNSSMIVANPYLMFGNFSIDSDFSYGRSTKYAGYLMSPVCLSKTTTNLPAFFSEFHKISPKMKKGFSSTIEKSHFYRNYTRLMYDDTKHNIKIITGDVATRNVIGFQSPFSGGGISISRQNRNNKEINPGTPLVITKISKVEVRLGEEILRVKILEPGTYTVDDLGEEAKLPGAKIKISDQVSRSEMIDIAYFGGYGMPELGKDDFDFTVAFPHHYDIDDPYKIRYKNKPIYSGNYRITPFENITLAFGGQAYNNSYSVDFNAIFMTKYGKISPNIGFTDTYHGEKAFGAGIYYALPNNDKGIHWEILLATKSRGYGDLGKIEEDREYFDYYMNKYFSSIASSNSLLNGNVMGESSRSIVTRLYTDPIYGYTPAFIFRGEWSNNSIKSTQRLREYSISLTKSFFKCCTFTALAGLTYDDPFKGRNQESPDRRLTLSCCVNLGTELVMRATYSHLDGERMRKFGSITYSPESIPGLELSTEYTRNPGKSIPYISLKYSGKHGEFKAEETVVCSYYDKRATTKTNHSNSQLFIAGTCLTKKGFESVKKNNFNIIRTAKDFRK